MDAETYSLPAYTNDNSGAGGGGSSNSMTSGILLLSNNNNVHGNNLSQFDGMGEEFEEAGDAQIDLIFSMFRLCLAIFGVLANCVTAVVLAHKKIWSPTSILLLTLVAYDGLFLLASIPPLVVTNFLKVDMQTFAVICGIFYPLRYMAQTGSIYTTVTLTIERFLIVLRPLKARSFCTFGKMKRLAMAVVIFSVVFNIPRCFFYSLATSFPPLPVSNSTSLSNLNTTEAGAHSTQSSPNTVPVPIGEVNGTMTYMMVQSEAEERRQYYMWLYTRVYELYVSGVFFYLLPYALIPILNMQLLLAIKRRRDETRRISVKTNHQAHSVKATDKEDGLTMIVLGITVCFFICCLLPAIYNVIQMAEVPTKTAVTMYLIIANDTMLCINASTDFFFYCLLGRRFRTIFLQLFCRISVFARSHSSTGNGRYTDTCYHTV